MPKHELEELQRLAAELHRLAKHSRRNGYQAAPKLVHEIAKELRKTIAQHAKAPEGAAA